jgi:hypothetical protein
MPDFPIFNDLDNWKSYLAEKSNMKAVLDYFDRQLLESLAIPADLLRSDFMRCNSKPYRTIYDPWEPSMR